MALANGTWSEMDAPSCSALISSSTTPRPTLTAASAGSGSTLTAASVPSATVAVAPPEPVAISGQLKSLEQPKRIGIIVGSLRADSFSQAIANGIRALLIEGDSRLLIEQVNSAELPLYNQDFDDFNQTPASYPPFRRQVSALDAVIFVTPEYNRSVPAVLKNALDVGSRPAGQNVWAKKPCGIVSSSPGPIGGFGANQHLKQVLGFLNMRIMQQPEMYLGKIAESIEPDGQLSERTRNFLRHFTDAFLQWIT
jgi:chromate reductase